MLENLFKPKSNEELRSKVKQWNVYGFTFVAMLAIASLTFAFKLPESAALVLTSAMFLLVVPMIVMCILMSNHFGMTLQIQSLRQEILSAINWQHDSEKLRQFRDEIIEEIRTQAFKDGKKVTLRSRK